MLDIVAHVIVAQLYRQFALLLFGIDNMIHLNHPAHVKYLHCY